MVCPLISVNSFTKVIKWFIVWIIHWWYTVYDTTCGYLSFSLYQKTPWVSDHLDTGLSVLSKYLTDIRNPFFPDHRSGWKRKIVNVLEFVNWDKRQFILFFLNGTEYSKKILTYSGASFLETFPVQWYIRLYQPSLVGTEEIVLTDYLIKVKRHRSLLRSVGVYVTNLTYNCKVIKITYNYLFLWSMNPPWIPIYQ